MNFPLNKHLPCHILWASVSEAPPVDGASILILMYLKYIKHLKLEALRKRDYNGLSEI